MNALPENDELYALPLHHEAKVNRAYHLLFGAALALFAGLILLNHWVHGTMMIDLVFALLFLFIGYPWIAIVIRKPYLKLTEDHLEYKSLFGCRRVELTSITHIEIFSEGGFRSLRIWTQDQRKGSIWRAPDRMPGRDYDVIIGHFMFSAIDFHQLSRTIVSQMEQ